MNERQQKTAKGAALYEAFQKVGQSWAEYISPWTYDQPMVISLETNATIHRIQRLIHRAIRHFVDHYSEHVHLLPLPPQQHALMLRCQGRPYRVGTYRTDFLVDQERQIQVIEMNCRRGLNGYFYTGAAHLLADRYLANRPEIERVDEYQPFFDHIYQYFGDFTHVCVIKNDSGRDEDKLFVPIFQQAGYSVHVIPLAELNDNLSLLPNAALIGQFNQEDLYGLPDRAIEALIDANMLNDLRMVHLIHDKRFLGLLRDETFLEAIMSPDEIATLQQHVVPTYHWGQHPDLWETAMNEKNDWLIKPGSGGTSIDLYAGVLTKKSKWRSIWTSGEIERMVLQPFVSQHKIQGSIGTRQFHDWMTGTLLFFDNQYFGPGIFRTSSFPILNRTDDRKIAPLVTPDTERFAPENVL